MMSLWQHPPGGICNGYAFSCREVTQKTKISERVQAWEGLNNICCTDVCIDAIWQGCLQCLLFIVSLNGTDTGTLDASFIDCWMSLMHWHHGQKEGCFILSPSIRGKPGKTNSHRMNTITCTELSYKFYAHLCLCHSQHNVMHILC